MKVSTIVAGALALTSSLVLSQDCSPKVETSTYAAGPFYQATNVPVQTEGVICVEDDPTTITTPPILGSGVVYESSCGTPLVGAMVEIWQADDEGVYDPIDNLDTHHCRARMLTDENGVYTFSSFVPGKYDSRPTHYHYRISYPGCTATFTQLFFEGDPDIENNVADDLIRPLIEETDGSVSTTFDITIPCNLSFGDFRDSCRRDGRMFCPGVRGSTSEELCLREQPWYDLSPDCAGYLASTTPPISTVTKLPRSCQNDANLHCPNMKRSKQLTCVLGLDRSLLTGNCAGDLGLVRRRALRAAGGVVEDHE